MTRHASKQERDRTAGQLTPLAERMPVPERIRHTLTPLQTFVRCYAVDEGRKCPTCGRMLVIAEQLEAEGIARGRCLGCKRPLPKRCQNSGCADGVEPMAWEHKGKVIDWYDGGAYCERCTSDTARSGRHQGLVRSVPKLAALGAASWMPDVSWRNKVGGIARAWSTGARGITALYIHGPTGSGKSVAAAFICRRLYGDLGAVNGFVWTRERDVLDAHVAQYDSGEEPWQVERRAAAVKLLEDVKTTPLLVLDEVFKGGAGRYTPAQIERMWDILSHRFDEQLYTVLCSNMPAWPGEDSIWSLAFSHGADRQCGATLESRFGACGEYVDANGRDRRKVVAS